MMDKVDGHVADKTEQIKLENLIDSDCPTPSNPSALLSSMMEFQRNEFNDVLVSILPLLARPRSFGLC
jgi:hypothetical protein